MLLFVLRGHGWLSSTGRIQSPYQGSYLELALSFRKVACCVGFVMVSSPGFAARAKIAECLCMVGAGLSSCRSLGDHHHDIKWVQLHCLYCAHTALCLLAFCFRMESLYLLLWHSLSRGLGWSLSVGKNPDNRLTCTIHWPGKYLSWGSSSILWHTFSSSL